MRLSLSRLSLALVLAAMTGCETASDFSGTVRDRMAAREAPRTKVYAAEPRATYEAVKAVALQMDYKFLRGGPAQGEFEAVSRIGQGESVGSSRQIGMKVKLQATLDGKGTRVSVRLTEIIESDSSNRAGRATETPLRDTPQYEVFFQRVGKVLGVPATVENAR